MVVSIAILDNIEIIIVHCQVHTKISMREVILRNDDAVEVGNLVSMEPVVVRLLLLTLELGMHGNEVFIYSVVLPL